MSWVKAFSLSKLGRSAKVHVTGDADAEGGEGDNKEPDASDEGQLLAMHFASIWRNKHRAAKKSEPNNTTTHAVKPSESSQSTAMATEKTTPTSTPPVINSSSGGSMHIETEPYELEKKPLVNTIIWSKSASSVSKLNLIDLEHYQRASDTHALDIHSHRSYDGPLALESRKNSDQHSDSPPFSPTGMNTLTPGAAERRRVSFFHRTDVKDPSTEEVETKSAPISGGLDYLDFSNRNLIQQVDESSDTDSNKSKEEPNTDNKNHTAYQITPATPTSSEASPKVTRKTSVMDNIKLMTSKLVSSVITPRPQSPPMTARQHLDALINPSSMPKAAGGEDEESYRSPFSEWKHR